jgi:hypothetical protein
MNGTTYRGYTSVFSIVWGLVFVLVFALPDAALAQSTDDVPDSQQARVFDKRQTSPFPLPEVSDEVFAVGSGAGLDTGCTFRDGGPLEIEIGIDRYVGEVDGDGFLTDPTSPTRETRTPVDLWGQVLFLASVQAYAKNKTCPMSADPISAPAANHTSRTSPARNKNCSLKMRARLECPRFSQLLFPV